MRGDILLALLVIGWAGIDMSVSLPSLWLYIKSLGGTKSDYGLAGAIANAVSFVTAPLFGWMSDRFSSKVIVVVSLLIQALGGLIYAFAALAEHPAECSAAGAGSDSCENTLDDDKVWAGPYVVIVGRFVIGLASGNVTTCRAYLTRMSPPADKTRNLGLAGAAWRIGLCLGPVINSVIIYLPRGIFLGTFPLTNLTWVGYFITITALVYLWLACTLMKTEEEATAAESKSGLKRQAVAGKALVKQLVRSRAWVMQYIGFANNFALAILQYFLPLYCLEVYNFRQVQTSNVFAVYGAVAACTSMAAAKLSPRMYERTILASGEAVQTISLLGCVLVWGGCSLGWTAPALPIWGTFLLCGLQSMGQAWQVPGLQGSYLFLVGSAGQGMYQAIFMSATSIGRMLGAYWVGFATEDDRFPGQGYCAVWFVVAILFVLIWVLLLVNWRAFDPVAITKMNGSNAVQGPSGFSTGCRTVALQRPRSSLSDNLLL